MCIHWSRKTVAKEIFVNPMTTLGFMSNKAEKEYIGPNCLHESLTFGKWQSYWSALFCFSWYHECCYVLFFSISAIFVFLFKLLPCACLVYCNSIPIKKLKNSNFCEQPNYISAIWLMWSICVNLFCFEFQELVEFSQTSKVVRPKYCFGNCQELHKTLSVYKFRVHTCK